MHLRSTYENFFTTYSTSNMITQLKYTKECCLIFTWDCHTCLLKGGEGEGKGDEERGRGEVPLVMCKGSLEGGGGRNFVGCVTWKDYISLSGCCYLSQHPSGFNVSIPFSSSL